MLDKTELNRIFETIKTKKICIIGDFCVDIYWNADMTKSELSRETPHFPLPVTDERVYLGAGGNVAANLMALRPAAVIPVTLVGDDWRGMLMTDIFKNNGFDTRFVIKTPGRFTNAYCKPMRKGISDTVYEDPRLDFDNYTSIDEETEKLVIKNLRKAAKQADVIIVADQFKNGIMTDEVRKEINAICRTDKTVIVDSRYNIDKYSHCILKPNEVECWRAVYHDERYLNASYEDFCYAAETLANNNSALVFCTLGGRGSVVTMGFGVTKIDAVKCEPPIDICGAGDTTLSAFASAFSCSASVENAARFASFASAVTIKKIGVTGTASPEEILALFDLTEDNTNRFDGLSGVYAESRPGYLDDAVNNILASLPEHPIIADIGSGTGKLSKMLLDKNAFVYCVEPNDEMRAVSEKYLKGFNNVRIINGTCDKTTIEDKSVDCITVAQAFHWFEPNAFLEECRRILKPDGKVYLLWNTRDVKAPVNERCIEIYSEFCDDFHGFSKGMESDDTVIREFFGGEYKKEVYPFPLVFNKEQFVKRCLSSSYTLRENDPGFADFKHRFETLFDDLNEDGTVIVPNETTVYFNAKSL
jgi:rfaE bifunctional protein kinase chain/domain